MYSFASRFSTLAGTPATMAFAGTSLTTTALAPTIALSPIDTFPITLAPELMITLFPIFGAPHFLPPRCDPNVTP